MTRKLFIKSYKQRIDLIEQKLQLSGTKVSLENLRRYLYADPKLLTELSPTFNATLDFITRLHEIFGCLIELVEVEPQYKSTYRDVDILMIINGKSYLFQVKARNFMRSRSTVSFIKDLNVLVNEELNNFGVFVKAVRCEDRFSILNRKTLKELKDDYSLAVIYEPIHMVEKYELKQAKDRLSKGANQLRDESHNAYKVFVYDARFLPAKTETLIAKTRSWLLERKFHHLSGVIYLRLGIRRYSRMLVPYLIPVSNRNSQNPLDEKPYYYGQLQDTLMEPAYLLGIPIHIQVRTPGWNNLLEIKPGYKIFRKEKYLGSLTPPITI